MTTPRTTPLYRRTATPGAQTSDEMMNVAIAGLLGQQLFSAIDPSSGLEASVYQANVGSVNLFSPQDAGLATISINYGYAPGVTNVIRGASVAQLNATFTPAQVFGLVTAANLRLSDGTNLVSGMSLSDAADNQAPLTAGLLASIARLQAFDGTNYNRLRAQSAANVAAATQPGALVVAPPGNWSINNTPAVNTQATITRAAGGAGVRHVCTSISGTLIGQTGAVEATVLLNLRDGATGAGAILWSQRYLLSAVMLTGVALTGLQIPGTANTAMTLEWAAAGGALSFESVALTGYDI